MTQGDATSWGATTPVVRDAIRAAVDESAPAALATVVAVEGSAYRRPGAKMLVPEGGDSLGAITAGCLEGPVGDLAATVRETGETRIETYDLTDDEGWGMGLGCNGIVTVLVEPVDGSFGPGLDALAERRPVAVLTGLDGPYLGARALMTAEDTHAVPDRDRLPSTVTEPLEERAVTLREAGRAGVETVPVDGEEIRVFIDGQRPAPELLIVGSQPDVNPVAEFARSVGFRVTVAATRGSVDAARFPAAGAVEHVRAPDVGDIVAAPADTYAVVMTHNFVDDRLAVEELLAAEVPYVGLMGPRERFEEMQAAWAEETGGPDAEALDRLATPVGLDLGGGEPAQIALAIVAEAVAVRNGRDGGRLRAAEGPIHPRVEER
ncbi:MAG: XdhC family protein [Halobacteriaceae archaeon]